jgi:hypothetical protein
VGIIKDGYVCNAQMIHTLIPDIQKLVTRKDGWFDEQLARSLSEDISSRLSRSFNGDARRPALRLSQMGNRCPKALWLSIHHPELAQALPPWAEVKFSFGHILEAEAVAFCKAAGHKVEGEQHEVVLDGVKGHLDAIVDGVVVDFKSCSQRNFEKLKKGTLRSQDDFGYLDQLDGYVVATLQDPRVTVKDRGYIFGIDKTLGHMVLYEHIIRPDNIRERIRKYKEIVARTSPPSCECQTRPRGESGNIELGTVASYNVFKYQCFPGLRTFLYASGPVYLTHVARKPDVIEINQYGKVVYQ